MEEVLFKSIKSVAGTSHADSSTENSCDAIEKKYSVNKILFDAPEK